MRKVLAVVLAVISVGPLSPASAERPSVEALCNYAGQRCASNCPEGKTYDACFYECVEQVRTCIDNKAQIQIRGFSKGSAGGNLKDFPGASGAATGPNTHAVGTTTNGMSANQGVATVTMPAASGPVSTPVNPPSSSSNSKPAGGGSGLLSRPGMPKLKAQ